MLDTAKVDLEAQTAAAYSIPPDTLKRLGRGNVHDGKKLVRSWVFRRLSGEPVTGPTERPADVRVATPADESALLELMLLDVQENALPIAQPSPAKILKHIQIATRRQGGILGVIDGPHGKPVACLNLSFFQWWWSEAYFLQEVWNFVHPEHRISKHADHLLKFARWCSDDMTRGFGYQVWLLMGVTAREHVEKKVTFYSRYGNEIGSFFIYPHPGNTKNGALK